jgi:hypothetical protein
MKTHTKPYVSEQLQDHESGVRALVAKASGEAYVALRSLSEAQVVQDGVVIFEGDYGGQIYLVARAASVRCSEGALRHLLSDLDGQEWDDPEGARVCFERRGVGMGVSGGMGGGIVSEAVWLHPRLEVNRAAVLEVLDGKRTQITEDAG